MYTHTGTLGIQHQWRRHCIRTRSMGCRYLPQTTTPQTSLPCGTSARAHSVCKSVAQSGVKIHTEHAMRDPRHQSLLNTKPYATLLRLNKRVYNVGLVAVSAKTNKRRHRHLVAKDARVSPHHVHLQNLLAAH